MREIRGKKRDIDRLKIDMWNLDRDFPLKRARGPRKARGAPPRVAKRRAKYSDWPPQSQSAQFVEFIQKQFARYLRAPVPENPCEKTGEFLRLHPAQKFLSKIIAPDTSVRRMLIAAATGAGKTVMVSSILCNFLN